MADAINSRQCQISKVIEEATTHPLGPQEAMIAASTIVNLARLFDNHLRHSQGPEGLSLAEVGVLSAIRRGITFPSAIARARHLDPARVTRIVEHLVGLGLILRETATDDRRCSPLALTTLGTARLEVATAHLRTVMEEVLGKIAPAHQSALIEALKEVRLVLDRMA
ncbi:MAG: MarR family transcriptional regulator [Chloroflexi bacterium]|nr:MarR family transcriptional regulator [Chloroflexota bacterium]